MFAGNIDGEQPLASQIRDCDAGHLLIGIWFCTPRPTTTDQRARM
jgi:hypothetical protein